MSEKDIEKLIKENNELHTENVAFRTEISVLKEEMAVMQNQLDWFKRQMFGRKTEQTSVILEGGEQLSMFPKDENEKPQSSPKNEETITIPEHKRRKKRTFEDAMGELPAEEIVYELEEKVCDKCGAEMVEIGVEKRDELVYTPAKFHVRRHIVKVYKCTKCGRAVPFQESRLPESNDTRQLLFTGPACSYHL